MTVDQATTDKQAQAMIDALDLKCAISIATETNGWTAAQATTADKRYRAFLFVCWQTLKAGQPAKVAQTSKLGDQLWHSHILLTAQYRRDCDAIFGEYLNHDTFDCKSYTADDVKQLQDATRVLFQAASKPFVDQGDPDHNDECAWCLTP